MNLKTLVIYENKVLFDILDELNQYLNFQLLYLDKHSYNQSSFNKLDNYLVLCKKNDKLFDNQLILDAYPLKIFKLLEIININFLKNKFNFQSEIDIGPYKLDLNSRKIFFNNDVLDLTEREADVLMFIYNSKSPVSINNLQKEVWGYVSQVETHTVETHIYRLRKKIKDKFDNHDFIISTDDGYVIK